MRQIKCEGSTRACSFIATVWAELTCPAAALWAVAPLWITTISSQMWKIAKFTLQHNYPQLLIINNYYWLIIICIIDWQQKVCCGKFTFFPCSQWSTKKAQTIFIHYNVESRNQWNFAALAKATVGGLTPVTLTAAQHRLTLTLTSLPPPPMGKLPCSSFDTPRSRLIAQNSCRVGFYALLKNSNGCMLHTLSVEL